MMYSCAIWGEEEGGVRGDLDGSRKKSLRDDDLALEAAQKRKIKVILEKARLRKGQRLLEIGSGWGAMAIEAAKMGCIVDTITLSVQQKELTEFRAQQQGVSDTVRVHLLDYRQLPKDFEKAFDALISCEMIEAVGPAYHAAYFQMVDWALKSDVATVVITATSQPEFRYSQYQSDCFARHYHWPNTFLPSATALPNWVQMYIPGQLVLANLEDHNIHYPRTLREWGRRLERNFCGDVVASLQSQYSELNDEHNLEAFKRKWKYMFAYAEAGFAKGYSSLNCWTFYRPENVAVRCD